jgi:hypothetical protein
MDAALHFSGTWAKVPSEISHCLYSTTCLPKPFAAEIMSFAVEERGPEDKPNNMSLLLLGRWETPSRHFCPRFRSPFGAELDALETYSRPPN